MPGYLSRVVQIKIFMSEFRLFYAPLPRGFPERDSVQSDLIRRVAVWSLQKLKLLAFFLFSQSMP